MVAGYENPYRFYRAVYKSTAEESVGVDGAVTFRDMLDLLRATEPSEWPLADEQIEGGYRAWYTHYESVDPWSGRFKEVSYHPRTDRDSRWMRKAWLCANLTKKQPN